MLNSGDTAVSPEHAGRQPERHDAVVDRGLPSCLSQAREYLTNVLAWPADGEPGYVAVMYTVPGRDKGHQFWRGRAVRTVEEAEKELKWILAQSDTLNVYACMSLQSEYDDVSTKTGHKIKGAKRNQQNALALKSLFVDIDVKDKGYGSEKEAVAALIAFKNKVGLPVPSTLVKSGGGIHVYWTCDRALTLQEWQPLARALVNAASDFGLKFDAGCTIDSARVLRVPGTWNRKYNPPLPVELVTNGKHPEYTCETLYQILGPYKDLTGVTPKVTAPKLDLSSFRPDPLRQEYPSLAQASRRKKSGSTSMKLGRSVHSSKRRWTPEDAITLTRCGTSPR
jgi:hypothetical protein